VVASNRADRRLRAEIEEDVLTPLGFESFTYHGGDPNGNVIRRLMEHADGTAIGMKQKLDRMHYRQRDQNRRSDDALQICLAVARRNLFSTVD
jgi:hypothetical protein